jgi:hypothetical protein
MASYKEIKMAKAKKTNINATSVTQVKRDALSFYEEQQYLIFYTLNSTPQIGILRLAFCRAEVNERAGNVFAAVQLAPKNSALKILKQNLQDPA